MSPRPVKVITNALEVIQVLAEGGPLSPADISERTGIPRSSVYRLADSLNSILLTETLPDTRIRLSSRWLHLADSARAAMTEWSKARPVLDELQQSTGQTAFLSVLNKDTAVCVDWAPGRGIGILILKPGRILPLHAGAAGRVLLAHSKNPEDHLRNAPFPAFTPHTLTEAEQLRADIESTRREGFTVSRQDVTIGIGAIGVPVFTKDGALAGCVSLGGLIREILAREKEFVSALRKAAHTLTR